MENIAIITAIMVVVYLLGIFTAINYKDKKDKIPFKDDLDIRA